ncbi:MAG: hypothetical protein U5J63_03755 [Fodinibius sp.]|nr:hypothetical protein [Fodinibius sp.]
MTIFITTEGDTDLALYQPAGGSLNPASGQIPWLIGYHYAKQDGRKVFKKATVGMADVC